MKKEEKGRRAAARLLLYYNEILIDVVMPDLIGHLPCVILSEANDPVISRCSNLVLQFLSRVLLLVRRVFVRILVKRVPANRQYGGSPFS